MASSTVRDVHVSAPLSSLSIGYHPSGMIAEQAATVVPVLNENDKYYIWNAGDAARLIKKSDGTGSLRADGAVSEGTDFSFTTAAYVAEEYALHTRITDREMANADNALQLQISKVRRVQDLVLLDQEIRVANLFTTAANWAAANTFTKAGVNQWNNVSFAGSIEGDIDAGREIIRQGTYGMGDPNQLIVPKAVAMVMKRDAKIRDLVKYTHGDLLVDGDLPAKLWGMSVLIPKVASNPTTEGQTATSADVWGKNVVMHFRNPSPSLDTLMSVAIFRARPWTVFTWRQDEVRSQFYEPSLVQTEVVTSNVAGALIAAAIA